MAADGYGSHGEPQFDDDGAPDAAVDPTLVAQYAGIVGNRAVGTASDRAAFTSLWTGFSDGPWDGLAFYETDTDVLYQRSGSSWLPRLSGTRSFTPSWTNYTRGNGTTDSWYSIFGGVVQVEINEILGSTSAVGSNPSVAVPLATAFAPSGNTILGSGVVTDASGTFYPVTVFHSGSAILFRPFLLGGTYASFNNSISGTVPFTWTTSDRISLKFTVPLI